MVGMAGIGTHADTDPAPDLPYSPGPAGRPKPV
jgi:hypothetical protein